MQKNLHNSKIYTKFAVEFTPKPFLRRKEWVLYILMAFIDALYLTHKSFAHF